MNYQNQEKINYLLNFYTLEQIQRYCSGDERKLIYLWEVSQPQEICIEDLSDVRTGQRYYADSPDGWVEVVDWVKKQPKQIYRVVTENGFTVDASDDHLFQKSDNTWVYTRNLQLGDILITEVGDSPVIKVDIRDMQPVYDLSINHNNHRYFTGGICSHNTGKSLFLQNIARNWTLMGLNVVYVTLELSEDLVGLRFDAMMTEIPTKQVFKNIDNIALRLDMVHKKTGNNYTSGKKGSLQIVKMPEAGTTCKSLEAYLKEYEIQKGYKPDALVVDYLDLLHPNNMKISPADLFVKDKYTSEELRALAYQFNVLCVTASQLNRNSVQAEEYDASHIAGGISKINTADNVIAIFTSIALRDRGQYKLKFLKTRSSSGVGTTIWLKFHTDILRIVDMPAEEQPQDDSTIQDIKTTLSNKTVKVIEKIPASPVHNPVMAGIKGLREGLINKTD
jgi:KaiC/GvpD/RAD55 family RecA-like ATPase